MIDLAQRIATASLWRTLPLLVVLVLLLAACTPDTTPDEATPPSGQPDTPGTDVRPPPPAAAKSDQEQILGAWRVVSSINSGERDPEMEGEEVFFSRDLMILTDKRGVSTRSDYSINWRSDPKQIDQVHVFGPGLSLPAEGIYDLDGDRLTICSGLDARPGAFESFPDDGRWLMELEKLHREHAAAAGEDQETLAAVLKAFTMAKRNKDRKVVEVLGPIDATDDDLARLKDFKELEFLGLEFSGVSDDGLSHLGGLQNLRVLKLGTTGIGDQGLANLAGLRLLEELDLSATGVSDDGLQHLGGLQNLRVLKLGATGIGDQGLSNLAGLHLLEELHLSETGVSDAGLRHLGSLEGLRVLSLAVTAISDKGILHLAELASLEELDLRATQVSALGIGVLQDALPQCEVLHDYGDSSPDSIEEPPAAAPEGAAGLPGSTPGG